MAIQITHYPDAFATTHENSSVGEFTSEKLKKRLRNLRKRYRALKKSAKTSRAAEKERQRAEEAQRAAEESRKKERSFLSRIGDAIVKAVPVILGAAVSFLMKGLFKSKKLA
jgi:anti-sigma factor RsiW